MAEWSIATDCKSVALTGYLGSNPGLSTLHYFTLLSRELQYAPYVNKSTKKESTVILSCNIP
jgi:hypothetical protein